MRKPKKPSPNDKLPVPKTERFYVGQDSQGNFTINKEYSAKSAYRSKLELPIQVLKKIISDLENIKGQELVSIDANYDSYIYAIVKQVWTPEQLMKIEQKYKNRFAEYEEQMKLYDVYVLEQKQKSLDMHLASIQKQMDALAKKRNCLENLKTKIDENGGN